MEREKTDERFQQIRQTAYNDPAILAFFVTGPRSVGFENANSDSDYALVVEDEAFELYEHRFEGCEPEIETEVFTLEMFRSHAAWGGLQNLAPTTAQTWVRQQWHNAWHVRDTGVDFLTAAWLAETNAAQADAIGLTDG